MIRFERIANVILVERLKGDSYHLISSEVEHSVILPILTHHNSRTGIPYGIIKNSLGPRISITSSSHLFGGPPLV